VVAAVSGGLDPGSLSYSIGYFGIDPLFLAGMGIQKHKDGLMGCVGATDAAASRFAVGTGAQWVGKLCVPASAAGTPQYTNANVWVRQ